MTGSTWKVTTASAGVLAGVLALASGASPQGQMGHGGMPGMAMPEGGPKPPPPLRATMEALHQHGGVPPGWRFLMPPGNPAEGRKVYAALECFKCHAIQGESFPAVEAESVGPDLTGMGQRHPPEYLAESILNPNRVIVEGPGFTGPDGLSKMPDYGESLTVRQLIDLVAYLGSLTGGGHPMGGPMPPAPPKGP